jgi:hypothetical protein
MVFDVFPSGLTFNNPLEYFSFPEQLGNWCHDKGKISNKTSVELCHSIEHLNLLR